MLALYLDACLPIFELFLKKFTHFRACQTKNYNFKLSTCMNLKFSGIFSSTIEKLGAKFGVLSSTLRCFFKSDENTFLQNVFYKRKSFLENFIIFHVVGVLNCEIIQSIFYLFCGYENSRF